MHACSTILPTANNSSVEFHLRLREFLQLVKAGDRSKALEYATVHLAPAAGDHPTEVSL
jgi:CTLH/CRA C-terminal to LisH motif domain